MTRYDLVPNYRCGGVIDEMEPHDYGDWVRHEDVEAQFAALAEALIELQAASWSRQWTRVLAARARVKELTGIDVPGPLRAELKALAVDGGQDKPSGTAVPSKP
jgi:hypothetical protein